MRVFEATIDIAAPPDVVWEHLADFESYPDWNPFILWAEGDLVEGGTVRFGIPTQKNPLTATVLSVKPGEALIWAAKSVPGVQPKYIRRLEAVDAQTTRFINREEFSGPLVWLARPVLNKLTPLYEQTCIALRNRVEAATANQ